MQDDNQSSQPISPQEPVAIQQQPVIAYTAPAAAVAAASPPAAQSQRLLEYVMFGFATLTIMSFLFNNGMMLKIGIAAALVVAIVSISKSFFGTKTVRPVTFQQTGQDIQSASQSEIQQAQRPVGVSIFKIVGITLLVLVMLPVLGYALLIGFFIVMLMLGGGSMGS